MNPKPVSPYVRLRRIAATWASSVIRPQRTTMWLYPKAKLGDTWTLTNLHERVSAAAQLGYDVAIKATDDGLLVQYVKRPPDPPNEFWS